MLTTGGSDSVTLTEAQIPVHNHSFSATTSSFDYGTKSTNSTGAHTHGGSGRTAFNAAGSNYATVANGTVTNPTTASSGAHTHTVSIGAHTHTVSGTTGIKGGGAAITVTNAYIMLMGWYRMS
ncbi:hypothetical protein [Providencia rettgeri]|uniref:hypothetical protein n=1 Tax=Providencia rettgeri TaxID=587 RepID=UPI002552523C|nr:hypothetical protein [Providencia rettgeri]